MIMAQRVVATVGVLLACVIFTASAEREKRQLPCTHPLRISYPEYFAHCDSVCMYTDWGSWRKVPKSVVSVLVTQCPSKKAYSEERTRTATGTNCTEPLRETQTICLPTQEERLILGLGLGLRGSDAILIPILDGDSIDLSVGDSYDNVLSDKYKGQPQGTTGSQGTSPPTQGTSGPQRMSGTPGPQGIPSKGTPGPQGPDLLPLLSRQKRNSACPRPQSSTRICHTLPGIGKRSIKNKRKDHLLPKENDVVYSDIDPIPFDRLEHGPRLRNKRNEDCSNQTQHVLFVLDTSGSVGGHNFKRMKIALGKLIPLFCKQVKFALITFSDHVHLEFCFNCFDNTYNGRSEVIRAIESVPHRGGWTNTGGTARCICEEILQPKCGIDAYPDHLDVVFITDGYSNDYNLKICEEIRCLHNRLGIDTYAIGINNGWGWSSPSYNLAELDCITNYGDLTSAFEFESFKDFEGAINSIPRLLLATDKAGSCAKLDSSISPTCAVLFGTTTATT